MGRRSRYSPEVRERAVRMVFEHEREYSSQWGAVTSIAAKIGCTAETLRKWVRQAERDQGRRAGLTTDERQRLKDLERENRELKRTNEILRKASAFFEALAVQLHSTENMLKTFLVVSNTKPFQNLAFRQANSHPVTFAAHINSYSNR